ncbi:hypothetical protein EI427_21210 [Flammeovirga pectinis]|uniref:Carboxypeptidase-like regulatory domain-containing protein n=1 Tax=Flammeovirga pectinis TaxID=2494373 RepID=A0A3Q9FTL8_9BACT|nr:carboxypeptidase-like regulatory domain-containing protein [Flammeovirga pectinis]AZQ64746.1 hypothetical protein EI427_21210 [Flammeovirga pectinis]
MVKITLTFLFTMLLPCLLQAQNQVTLKSLSDSTEIIFIGEPYPGDYSNFMETKTKYVDYLSELNRCDMILFEAGFSDMIHINDNVENLKDEIYQGYTREFHELFKIIQERNILLGGFDIRGFALETKFFELIEEGLLTEKTIEAFDLWKEYYADCKQSWGLSNKMKVSTFLRLTTRLNKEIESNTSLTEKSRADLIQILKNTTAYVLYLRDADNMNGSAIKANQMADNIRYHINKYPNKKVVILGMNYSGLLKSSFIGDLEKNKYQSPIEKIKTDFNVKSILLTGHTDSSAVQSVENFFSTNNLIDSLYTSEIPYATYPISSALNFNAIEEANWSTMSDAIVCLNTLAPYHDMEEDFTDTSIKFERVVFDDTLDNIERETHIYKKLKHSVDYTEVRGVVKDKETGEPISYTTIGNPEYNFATSTNEDGIFVLKIPSEYFTSKNQVIFSSLGYEKLYYKIEDLNTEEYYLQPTTRELSGVVIREKKYTPKDVFKKVNANLTKNYSTLPYSETVATKLIKYDSINDKLLQFKTTIKRNDKDGYTSKRNYLLVENYNIVASSINSIGENGLQKYETEKVDFKIKVGGCHYNTYNKFKVLSLFTEADLIEYRRYTVLNKRKLNKYQSEIYYESEDKFEIIGAIKNDHFNKTFSWPDSGNLLMVKYVINKKDYAVEEIECITFLDKNIKPNPEYFFHLNDSIKYRKDILKYKKINGYYKLYFNSSVNNFTKGGSFYEMKVIDYHLNHLIDLKKIDKKFYTVEEIVE